LGPPERRALDVAAGGRLGGRDRHLADEVVVVPGEDRVRLDGDVAVEVAAGCAGAVAGLALAGHADAFAFVHARRDLNRDHAVAHRPSGAAAGGAMVADDRAAAATIRAGGDHPEHAAEALLRDAALSTAL